MTEARPLLLFDGTCGLCSAAVQWVIARDKKDTFDFAALKSQAAKSALSEARYHDEPPDSLLLIDNGKVHVFSAAAVEVARKLGFPWSLAAAALVIPSPIRDATYRWIAARRHRLFKGPQACTLPHTDDRRRFLDADE